MKVIIGAGKVANIIKNANDEILSHNEIEITDKRSINSKLRKYPTGTVIVNTAAKISLEWCEENKELARDINAIGAANVAEVCSKFGHHLIHVGSGCIFNGMETEKLYDENDIPTPACWYAETKAEADKLMMNLAYEKLTIVRPRQLISPVQHPTNMLTKFATLKSGHFIDSKNSLTCIEDMKEVIEHFALNRLYGIYNVANTGWLSPYQIALKIKETINPYLDVKKTSYQEHLSRTKVKRVNTLLNINKLISTGYTPRSADAALEWCLKNYGKNV